MHNQVRVLDTVICVLATLVLARSWSRTHAAITNREIYDIRLFFQNHVVLSESGRLDAFRSCFIMP